MSDTTYVLSCVLVLWLSFRLLSLLEPPGGSSRSARSTAAQHPGPSAGPSPHSAPGTPPAISADQRQGLLLLGRSRAELDAAADAARRHLPSLSPYVTATGLGSEDAQRALLRAHVVVLGSRRPADTERALAACAAAGRPLLLPASR